MLVKLKSKEQLIAEGWNWIGRGLRPLNREEISLTPGMIEYLDKVKFINILATGDFILDGWTFPNVVIDVEATEGYILLNTLETLRREIRNEI